MTLYFTWSFIYFLNPCFKMSTSVLSLSSRHNRHANIKNEHAFYRIPNFEKKNSYPDNHIDIHIYVPLLKNV